MSQAYDELASALRTPTFFLRHVDIGERDQVSALTRAFDVRDASGRTLREKIEAFARFVADRVPEERVELLAALRRINTGTIFTSVRR